MVIGPLHMLRVMSIALTLFALLPGAANAGADMKKVLRISMNDITSLDPQQGTDLYSTRVTTAIFEAMYEFEYLSTGSKVIPNTAEAMPAITDDGRTWTMRVKKGILFADDPVFKGKPRELVAADYVYSIKRSLDPNLRQGGDAALTDLIVGARPVVDAARKPNAKFDYDARIEGLQATDRYTVVMRLAQPDYTLLERLAGLPSMAVAREAIEAAGADVMSKPVGTGPYRLKEWRRASRVVLEANPNYRTVRFPENADAPQQELVRNMRGKTLPQIGRIEISIIEESQPEILAFTQGDLDFIALGGDDTKRVMQNGRLRPDLEKRGIRHVRFGSPSVTFTYFNMEDPAVGGYSTQQIALRRAIGMGFDVDELIRVLFAGNALPANQLLPPGVSGHDPSLPAKSIYDPAGARALLDRFGFKDRDGDGYRETPDGKPLTIVRGSTPDAAARATDELWKRCMDAIGIRMVDLKQKWPELNKMSEAGQLMMWGLAWITAIPDADTFFSTLYSRNVGTSNDARFRLPEYDRLFEAARKLPDSPERTALYRRMTDLILGYAPWLLQGYSYGNVLAQPWVRGYRQHPFLRAQFRYYDVERTPGTGAGR